MNDSDTKETSPPTTPKRPCCCGPTPAAPKDVRESVKQAYTEALSKSRTRGSGTERRCCSPSPDDSQSTVASLAGYAEERDQFQEASASSFGCGNPLAFAGVEPGQTVVDLGSGAGLDLLIAARKVGADGKVIGIDMTGAMIDAARENAARAGFDNVEVRKGLIEELPIDSDSVDWVISNCVINLSPEKTKVFQEVHRILKPGGRFSISDIVVHDLPDWIRKSVTAYSACIAGAISEEEYLEGLRSRGLIDVEVKERLVYEADQIRSMVEADFGSLGLDEAMFNAGVAQVAGKIWSAKITGRKPM